MSRPLDLLVVIAFSSFSIEERMGLPMIVFPSQGPNADGVRSSRPGGRLISAALVLGLLLLSGCSRTAKVTGTVTVDGKPLPMGTITFTNEDGKRDSAEISEGKYTLLKAPVGSGTFTVDTSKVTQMKMALGGGGPMGTMGGGDKEKGAKMRLPGMAQGEEPPRKPEGFSEEEFAKHMQGGQQPKLDANAAAMQSQFKERMEKGELIEVDPAFSDPKRSPLKYTVKKGEQVQDLQVKALQTGPPADQ